jgi:nucleoside-diphosphate-sugar epimerase
LGNKVSNRILVTGATGFIGKHLVQKLKDSGHVVYSLSKSLGYDVCDNTVFSDFLDKDIDIVFHLAGCTFVPNSWEDPYSYYYTNILGTQITLEFCRKTNTKMIFISAYVYGVPKYLPIDENHPVAPNNPYTHSKCLAEELCAFYAREMGVQTIVLRPFNLYGPGQDKHFLIPELINQINRNGEIVVKDDVPRRDYLHICDFVEACISAINTTDRFIVFNIGYGASLSVKEIVELLIENSGKNIKWRSLNEKRKNEIPDTIADCTAIKKRLGWEPRLSFIDSICGLMD